MRSDVESVPMCVCRVALKPKRSQNQISFRRTILDFDSVLISMSVVNFVLHVVS